MQKRTYTIKGTSPFFFNPFAIESLVLTTVASKGSAGNNPGEWEESLKSVEDGNLYIPSSYVRGTLINGGAYIKKKMSSYKKPIESCIQIAGSVIKVGNKTVPTDMLTDPKKYYNTHKNDAYIDIRAVSNPNTKGKNIRYRLALSPGWEMTFSVAWQDDVVSPEVMDQAVYFAGIYEGIGNGRRIGMGRFEVVKNDQQSEAKHSLAQHS